jgi:hypothetical protein
MRNITFPSPNASEIEAIPKPLFSCEVRIDINALTEKIIELRYPAISILK